MCGDRWSFARLPSETWSLLRRLDRDERGVMSLLSVFCTLIFVLLIGMIFNVVRHVDNRIRLQTAADTATYSGGVTMARGMNTVAFSNHLLCEVFALTAYMREGANLTDRSDTTDEDDVRVAEKASNAMLDEWVLMGRTFVRATERTLDADHVFSRLARVVETKAERERVLLAAYGEMTAQQATLSLADLEGLLESQAFPDFEQVVVENTPHLAQLNADEVADRYAATVDDPAEGQSVFAVMWRGYGTEADTPRVLGPEDTSIERDWQSRTLPAVDPSPFGVDEPDDPNGDVPWNETYLGLARQQRKRLAEHYLERWTEHWMNPYFHEDHRVAGRDWPKMSQFDALWRTATRARLSALLEDEYRYVNLPYVYRKQLDSPDRGYGRSNVDETFVGVVYRRHLENDLAAEGDDAPLRNVLADRNMDMLAFAQTRIFLPRPRFTERGWDPFQRQQVGGWGYQYPLDCDGDDLQDRSEFVPFVDNWPPEIVWGGPLPRAVRDRDPRFELSPATRHVRIPLCDDPPLRKHPADPRINLEQSDHKLVDGLLYQNWSAKLVPATAEIVPNILRTPAVGARPFPSDVDLDRNRLDRISFH